MEFISSCLVGGRLCQGPLQSAGFVDKYPAPDEAVIVEESAPATTNLAKARLMDVNLELSV